MKNTPGDIIILYMCTINDNHMMYGYEMWWTEFFVILDHFLPFYPLTVLKTKILKNEKNARRYYHFTHVYHMMYGSWDMEHDGQNCFFILDHFLPFYPSKNAKNQKFEKMKKMTGDIIILHKCTKNHDHMLPYRGKKTRGKVTNFRR